MYGRCATHLTQGFSTNEANAVQLLKMEFPASYEGMRPVVEHEYFDHRAVPQLEEYLDEQVMRGMRREGCFGDGTRSRSDRSRQGIGVTHKQFAK